MSITIMAAGGGKTALGEIYHFLQTMIGDICSVKQIYVRDIQAETSADLFVCGITQLNHLLEKVPRDKILVVEPRFDSRFFVQIARVPAGNEIYIFHSSLDRIRLIIQRFHNLGINDVKFIPVSEEMPKEIVLEKLKKAKYIAGVTPFLKDALQIDGMYAQYLQPEVQIIGGDRISSIESACDLLKRLAAILQSTNTPDSLAMLEHLQKSVFKVFAAQFSAEMVLSEAPVTDSFIRDTRLVNANDLSDSLSTIATKLVATPTKVVK